MTQLYYIKPLVWVSYPDIKAWYASSMYWNHSVHTMADGRYRAMFTDDETDFVVGFYKTGKKAKSAAQEHSEKVVTEYLHIQGEE